MTMPKQRLEKNSSDYYLYLGGKWEDSSQYKKYEPEMKRNKAIGVRTRLLRGHSLAFEPLRHGFFYNRSEIEFVFYVSTEK